MAAIKIFISSVQKEFSEERKALAKYIREDVLLCKFFQPFIFEELPAINLSAPESEGAIAWNDPAFGIDWQIPASDVILSEKDKHHPLLADCKDLFDYSLDYYAE